MLTFISDEASTDTSLPILGFDPLTDGLAAGAMRFLFDNFKDFEASHADAPYTNGQVIEDLSETGDGSMVVASGDVVTSNTTYGGANFSAITKKGNYIAAPSGTLAPIFSGSQYFAVAFYVVLPSAADWNTDGSITPFFASTIGATGYATPEADMVTIAEQLGGVLSARRQTAGGSATVNLAITLDAAAYGRVALVMYWRNAAGIGLRIKTSATDQSVSGAVGAVNTGDFSAKAPQFGVGPSFWLPESKVPHQNASNFTMIRGWIENLQASGRTPATVFNEDWARIVARYPGI